MDTLTPAPLSRRLFFAYFGAFAIVIAVFALGVRFAFVATLERQADVRLETLARAGLAVVHFAPRRYTVDRSIVRAIRNDREGLQWFDLGWTPLQSEGLVSQASGAEPRDLDRLDVGAHFITRAVEIRDPSGRVRGYVRASESDDALSAATRALDLGLAIGALLAIGTATAGGWFLARHAVRKTDDSFQRLRQFTGDASHELRGPIGAIAHNAELAREEGTAAAMSARLEKISELASDMRRLVDDLLILARAAQPLTRELFVVDARTVLAHVSERYAGEAAAKGLDFRIASSHPPPIYGNPEQIERIVMNLVENAIRYTHRGAVEVTCASDAANVRIAVKDTGIGITAKHLPYVFDRFWRADPTRSALGGTGLGLPIALALARRHGGSIAVASQPEIGSEFSVALPRRPVGAAGS